jgi:hypothetical protein
MQLLKQIGQDQNTSIKLNASSGNWNISHAGIGLALSTTVFKRLHFDFRAIGGVAYIVAPAVNISVDSGSTQKFRYYNQDGGSKMGSMITAGFNIRYPITERFGIFLKFDYFYTVPNFGTERDLKINTNFNSDADRIGNGFLYAVKATPDVISQWNFGLGFCIQWGNNK